MLFHGSLWAAPLLIIQQVQITLASALIPDQLVMTGKPDKVDDMPLEVRGNILNMIALESRTREAAGRPPIHLRWLGDSACHQFIAKHFDEELAGMFDKATPGYYKGDICRTAVLLVEGGFYMDVDLELKEPLLHLVDDKTTFMSAYSVNGDILNALLAVVPRSPVMQKALDEMRKWYQNKDERKGLMGTQSTYRGLTGTIKEHCPEVEPVAMRATLQWNCGDEVIRLYEEKDLLCFLDANAPQPMECPEERKTADDYFMRYGIFEPSQPIAPGRKIVGWPRFKTCKDTAGCGSGGHGFLQTKDGAETRSSESSESLAVDFGASLPQAAAYVTSVLKNVTNALPLVSRNEERKSLLEISKSRNSATMERGQASAWLSNTQARSFLHP